VDEVVCLFFLTNFSIQKQPHVQIGSNVQILSETLADPRG